MGPNYTKYLLILLLLFCVLTFLVLGILFVMQPHAPSKRDLEIIRVPTERVAIENPDDEIQRLAPEGKVPEKEIKSAEPKDQEKKTQPAKQSASQTPENPKERGIYYTFKKGDTLWNLSKKIYKKDPWFWKAVLYRNTDRIEYTLFDAQNSEWSVKVKLGTELDIGDLDRYKELSERIGARYAVQIASYPQGRLDEAIGLTRKLIKKGLYAYMYLTDKKLPNVLTGKRERFHRIRAGFFKTPGEAMEAGKQIYERYGKDKLLPSDFFAVKPSNAEISGEKIDLGIQDQRPYVAELFASHSLEEVAGRMNELKQRHVLTYISKTLQDGKAFYRLRYGFFADSKNVLEDSKRFGEKFGKIRAVKLNNLFEAALGQNTGNKAGKLLKAK